MRLLHVDTLELHEFDDKIPEYAILSHRWQDDEVSYKDVRKRQNLSSQGWQKVENFCQLVQREKPHMQYAWIDTCCIDKRSSAELSEAINSMYMWYELAEVCFVYLSDVDRYSSDSAGEDSFRKSVWFTRSWTLQELIAPCDVYFVASNWLTIIGTKQTLAKPIADVTRIDVRLLEIPFYDFSGNKFSIAQKMSWAATRVCARAEDRAYSLMGLFDVNMPLLYGEGGRKAFIRLQTEILKISDDESIFAWRRDLVRNRPQREAMLAPSPRQFWHSNNIIRHNFTPRSEYAMTNKGIRFEAVLGKITSSRRYFILNCCEQALSGQGRPLALFVRRTGSDLYERYQPSEETSPSELQLEKLRESLSSGTPQRFYVK